MIKIVIGTLGVTFRMLLRYWTSDSRVLTANITDLEQFAQQCGLTILEARKFRRSKKSNFSPNTKRYRENQSEGRRTDIGNFPCG